MYDKSYAEDILPNSKLNIITFFLWEFKKNNIIILRQQGNRKGLNNWEANYFFGKDSGKNLMTISSTGFFAIKLDLK